MSCRLVTALLSMVPSKMVPIVVPLVFLIMYDMMIPDYALVLKLVRV